MHLPGGTLGCLLALETPFDAVRLVFHVNRAEPWRIAAASVAVAARERDDTDPVDADDRALPFTPVSFDSRGTDAPADAPSGTRRSLDMPASAEEAIFALAFSDWVPLASIPRAEGGGDGRPLLVCRVYAPGGLWAGGGASLVAPDGWPAEHEGRLLRAVASPRGDFTATAFNAAARPSRWHLPAIVQYRARRPGATVLAVGDSLAQGVVTANGDRFAWGHYATAAISTRARPVAFVNGGCAGQPSRNYLRNGRTDLDLLRPDIVTIAVWSPNDPKAAAATDVAWQAVLDFARHARSCGAVPILATAVPFNLRPERDALRQANNARARALAASGAILLADLDAALADPAAPASVRAPFRAPAGNHLSIAGYREAGAAAAPVIARALAALGLGCGGPPA